MRDYAYNVQPMSITIHFADGDSFVWPSTHIRFAEVRQAIKDGAEGEVIKKMMDTVNELALALADSSIKNEVVVTREGVYFRGELLHMTITERILAFIKEDFPVDPLILFLGKLVQNPFREAVLSLYDFLEANRIPITPDGDFLVYKRVRGDYLDIHSGTMSNHVGAKLRIPAWQVELNRDITCAKGLHVCSREYLPHFGNSSGNRVVICKVSPADVVSVPADYNNAKMRVCAYEVVGELNDSQKADIFDNAALVNVGADFSGDVTWSAEIEADECEWESEDYCEDCGEDYCEDCGEDCGEEPSEEPTTFVPTSVPTKSIHYVWNGSRFVVKED